jgi:arylsulfatase A-like enzyme
MTFNKDTILKILKVLNLGLITGFVVGLILAVIHIAAHRLLHYNLYNLMLFDIQSIVTEHLIIFALIGMVLVLLNLLLKRILQGSILTMLDSRNSENNIIHAVSVSLVLYIVIVLICYSFYPQILEYLKNTPLAEPLRTLNKSGVYKYAAFIILLTVTAGAFIYVLSLLLVKLRIISPIQNKLSAITNSKPLQTLGIIIFGTVLLYNGAIYGYRELNQPEGPNVILITIDTLRADHIGAYGYERNTSPNIDKLAQKGVLYEYAYAQAPWTMPSMSSMHTSYYPTQIKIKNIRSKIHDNLITLAEYLRDNFYKTSAVISNIVVSDIFGFDQGFDTFDQTPLRARDELTSHLVTDNAIEYIADNRDDKFFLWLHYMDPHSDYIHHPEIDYAQDYRGLLGKSLHSADLNKFRHSLDIEDLEYIKDLYDEEISYTDMHIGRVLDSLDKYGLKENTVIIITADHGEEFLERTRFGHNKTVYQELIHVPLIIYVPSDDPTQPKKTKSSVELRSIAKTIIDLCGLRNNHFSGENLLIIAEEENNDTYAFSQKPVGKNRHPKLEAISSGKWKLINDIQNDTYELYDLENDPGEEMNLFDTEGADKTVIKELISKASAIEKESVVETVEVDFKEEDIEKLKALGYIQ